MAYIDDEISLQNSQPIELHLFQSATTSWAYHSSNIGTTIDYSGYSFAGETIKCSARSISSNSLKNQLTVSIALSNDFVAPYKIAPIEELIRYTLYRGQSGDYVQQWKGKVAKINFKRNVAEILVVPGTQELKRSGLTKRFSIQCILPLYSSKCTVDYSLYSITGTISTVSGLTVTATEFASKADNYFRGGVLIANGRERMIDYHVGNTVMLYSVLPGLVPGMSFEARRGCPHTDSACYTDFNNHLNFGGQPYIPTKNPFVGDAIV